MLEASEDGVDAGVGVAATGGDVAGLVAGFLVSGVGDGRADRVGVGVFVTDYVGGGGGHGRVRFERQFNTNKKPPKPYGAWGVKEKTLASGRLCGVSV